MTSVFLSHNYSDKVFARKLAAHLRSLEITVWIDEAELNVGDSLLRKIAAAIDSCDYVAAVLSSNSTSSSWVQKELEIAMTQEIVGRRVKVLPIILEKCEIPIFLRDKVYADFTDAWRYDEAFGKLARALGIAPALVDGTAWRDRVQQTVSDYAQSLRLHDLEGRVLLHADQTPLGVVKDVHIGHWRIEVEDADGRTKGYQLDDPVVARMLVSTYRP